MLYRIHPDITCHLKWRQRRCLMPHPMGVVGTLWIVSSISQRILVASIENPQKFSDDSNYRIKLQDTIFDRPKWQSLVIEAKDLQQVHLWRVGFLSCPDESPPCPFLCIWSMTPIFTCPTRWSVGPLPWGYLEHQDPGAVHVGLHSSNRDAVPEEACSLWSLLWDGSHRDINAKMPLVNDHATLVSEFITYYAYVFQ